jgi:hypothetical protein
MLQAENRIAADEVIHVTVPHPHTGLIPNN